MTDRQKHDHEMITNLWHLLRDYGDLTNTEHDEARWKEFIDQGDQAAGNDPEAKALICLVENIVEYRSTGRMMEQRIMPEDEQDMLTYFRRMDSLQKKATLQMLKTM